MSASQTFKVGDVVEIVGSAATMRRDLIGRVGVIVEVGIAESWCRRPGEQWAKLSPEEINDTDGWYCRALRKINPPDWTAPLTTYREVEA